MWSEGAMIFVIPLLADLSFSLKRDNSDAKM
jgi:hypothetical protein